MSHICHTWTWRAMTPPPPLSHHVTLWHPNPTLQKFSPAALQDFIIFFACGAPTLSIFFACGAPILAIFFACGAHTLSKFSSPVTLLYYQFFYMPLERTLTRSFKKTRICPTYWPGEGVCATALLKLELKYRGHFFMSHYVTLFWDF